jgi:hypothetical protein
VCTACCRVAIHQGACVKSAPPLKQTLLEAVLPAVPVVLRVMCLVHCRLRCCGVLVLSPRTLACVRHCSSPSTALQQACATQAEAVQEWHWGGHGGWPWGGLAGGMLGLCVQASGSRSAVLYPVDALIVTGHVMCAALASVCLLQHCQLQRIARLVIHAAWPTLIAAVLACDDWYSAVKILS